MDSKEYKEFINQDFSSFSNWLFSLTPYEFTLIGTAIGYVFGATLTINQQNSLGNFFSLIGQVLQTINAQGITVSQTPKQYSKVRPDLQKESIEEEIKYIKEEMYKLIIELYGNTKI